MNKRQVIRVEKEVMRAATAGSRRSSKNVPLKSIVEVSEPVKRRKRNKRKNKGITLTSGRDGSTINPFNRSGGLQSLAGGGNFPSRQFSRVSMNPQRKVDVGDSEDSIRIIGGEILQAYAYNNTTSDRALANNGGTSVVSYRTISPGQFTGHLTALSSVYGYYAIRQCNIRFIPTVGPSSDLAGGLLSFAITQDINISYSIANPTFIQVAQFQNSATTPLWEPASISYHYNGEKTWPTNLGSTAENMDLFQLWFTAAFNTVLGGSAGAIGYFYCEYVVDLYESTIQHSVYLTGEEKRDETQEWEEVFRENGIRPPHTEIVENWETYSTLSASKGDSIARPPTRPTRGSSGGRP